MGSIIKESPMHELTLKLTKFVSKWPYLLDKYKAFVESIEAMCEEKTEANESTQAEGELAINVEEMVSSLLDLDLATSTEKNLLPLSEFVPVVNTESIENKREESVLTYYYLTKEQTSDIQLAAKTLSGPKRRKYMAAMSLKYCNAKPRLTERVFGWARRAVAKGLKEHNTGIVQKGLQSKCCGRKRWESNYPEAAKYLQLIAEDHAQQDPTFQSTLSYTRLTASAAKQALKDKGFSDNEIPSLSVMTDILNRTGHRLRKVVKAKPQRKIKATDAIFNNIEEKDTAAKMSAGRVVRISLDCKATVKPSESSRGGLTRGHNKASDHDFYNLGSYTPCGIVDEDTGKLVINIGSSFKTSDFIIDSLNLWWRSVPQEEQQTIVKINIKIDNGPENSGIRTHFLKRIVEFADIICKDIQLIYYPPYHSKYNPIERCWGILEQHWNGTILNSVNTMVEWAKTMTWKGSNPIVKLSSVIYKKGISHSKLAMKEIEKRLIRNPELPKYDILIKPSLAS
jgi:Rhodopirellula transposase DDE domain